MFDVSGSINDATEKSKSETYFVILRTDLKSIFIVGEFMGKIYKEPKEISHNFKQVTKIKCSTNMIFILTEKKCYSFGRNQYGESGTGSVEEMISEPTIIPLNDVEEIFASLFSRSLIIKASSNFYFFGQINGEISFKPVKLNIEFLKGEESIKDIGLSFENLVILTDKGNIYVKGKNNYKQCLKKE